MLPSFSMLSGLWINSGRILGSIEMTGKVSMKWEPILCHWSLFIPPENIKKPLVISDFQGVQKERDQWHEMR